MIMKQKIPCFCDNTFTVEIPDEIDLDAHPACIDEIINGAFLNFTCPSCGKKHKPEFDLRILWPSKNIRFEIFQELGRGEFYRRKKEVPEKGGVKKETIIGFPELSERILVYRDGLEPAAVEAIKYYLHVKAEENYPEEELDIWYTESRDPEGPLEFHIHGIKKDEVAVMKVPRSLYQKTLGDYRKHPKSEIFESLKVRSYLSVKNMMRPEALK
jgi:hypothetical protein